MTFVTNVCAFTAIMLAVGTPPTATEDLGNGFLHHGVATPFSNHRGVIWSVSYPKSGVVSFNPRSREFKDYGHVYAQNWPQYQRYVAADDAGWIYFDLGNTASQIVAFDPASGQAKPMLAERDRKTGSAYLYRDLDGKVYGQSLRSEDETWHEFYKGSSRVIGRHDSISPAARTCTVTRSRNRCTVEVPGPPRPFEAPQGWALLKIEGFDP